MWRRRVVRWLLVLAALGSAGMSFVQRRALAQAETTRTRLAAEYGEGCVTVIPEMQRAGLLHCRIEGLEFGHAFADHLPPDWSPKLSARGIVRDVGPATSAQVTAVVYDANGRLLDSFPSGKAVSDAPHRGQPIELLGPPLHHGFPLVLAIRATRREIETVYP